MPNSHEYHQTDESSDDDYIDDVDAIREVSSVEQSCTDIKVQSASDESPTPEDNDNQENVNFYPGVLFKKCLLPKCCQGKIFLLVLLCMAIVGQGMIVSGQLPITLSMLEKNFGYNSVETGSIHSCYDAFFGISSICVGLFGRKRKVMVIGIGIFIIAIGCFTFTLPHFMYNYKDMARTTNSSRVAFNTLKNKNHIIEEYGLCDAKRLAPNLFPKSSVIGYLVVFCFSYSLIGIGAAPLHTLAVVYMDECLTPQMNGIFLGVYYFFGAVGPALGFGMGYPFLSFPVTLKKDTNSILTSESESWIGAWWIGYILGGSLLTFVAIPTVLYPSIKLNNNPEECIEEDRRTLQEGIKSRLQNNIYVFINYFKSFKSLARNIPYLLLVFGMTIEGTVINGLGTFLAKLLEVQFRISSSRASLLSGALAVIGAGAGLLLGGLTIKKFESKKSKAILITTISILSSLAFGSFFLGCDTRELGKIPLNKEFEITDKKFECHKDCNCFSNKYEPICDVVAGITYFSACKAGCKEQNSHEKKMNFTKCSCAKSIDRILVQGGCNKKCNSLWWFMPLTFIALFLTFFMYVPQVTLTLQLLSRNTKSSGTGFEQILIRIGFILAPIFYGYLLDKSCILWSPLKSQSYISNCLEYNNQKMRSYVSYVSIFVKLSASFCYLAMIFFINKPLRDDKNKSTYPPTQSVYV